jgi:hypothetical protein
MNPEEKELLERVALLSEENNQILRGIRNTNRWNTAIKAIYWIVILGLSYGAFVYIQPYFDTVFGMYKTIQNSAGEVSKINNSIKDFDISSILKK